MNPFLSTPEAASFWQEQQQACEQARRLLVKIPEFSRFLAAGGGIDVVPMHLPAKLGYAALIKHGDSIIGAVHFVVNIECDAVIIPYAFGPYMVEQFSVYLEEAKELKPVAYKCDSCKFKKSYHTGMDEYPPCTTIDYCAKDHWDGGPEPQEGEPDAWADCEDFEPREDAYGYGQ